MSIFLIFPCLLLGVFNNSVTRKFIQQVAYTIFHHSVLNYTRQPHFCTVYVRLHMPVQAKHEKNIACIPKSLQPKQKKPYNNGS